MVLDRFVLHPKVGGELILVSWFFPQELNDPDSTWASAAAPEKKPEQASELRVVAHLGLKGVLVI
jgi:hypothetical protein